jgi:hypothetical protein
VLLLRRVVVQVQQESIVRRCIGLMRCRVLGATLAAWRQWAAKQRSMTERVLQAEVKRHAKVKAAVLRQWAAAAVVEAAQRRKLLLVVGTMRASALARWTTDQGRQPFCQSVQTTDLCCTVVTNLDRQLVFALAVSQCAAPAILLHECRSYHGWAAAASTRRHHRRVLASAVGRLTHRAAAAAFDIWASWVRILQTCEPIPSHTCLQAPATLHSASACRRLLCCTVRVP